jgi:glucokinase
MQIDALPSDIPYLDAGIQVLGIDLGGTAIKIGRFRQDGTCLQVVTVPTPQPASPEACIATVVDAIALADPYQETVAIGVGMPGPADAAGRVAIVAINLPGWQNTPLADRLEEKTGRSTVIANDANCAALGESWLGAGQAYQNFILLTLGTGVGGGIILNKRLFTGSHGAAGELGLITLHPEGPRCNSGNRGSLEQYTSAQAILRDTGKPPIEWGKLAEIGSSEALNFWQNYGRELGNGLASLVYVLTPEAILLGGGISGSAEFFLPAVIAELEERVHPTSRQGLTVLQAELGNRAGMVGAAKLALSHLQVWAKPE